MSTESFAWWGWDRLNGSIVSCGGTVAWLGVFFHVRISSLGRSTLYLRVVQGALLGARQYQIFICKRGDG